MKKSKRIICVIAVIAILFTFGAGCSEIKGDTVMSYESYKITETMYSYWMAKYKTTFLYIYNNSKDTTQFWSTEIEEGYTYEDFIVEYIETYAKNVLVAMYMFDNLKLSFSSSVKSSVNEKINELIDAYGTKADLNAYLGQYGLNVSTLEKIYYAEAKMNAVNEALFSEGATLAVTDDDREEYYKNNYHCANWIYIYTEVKLKKDETGGYVTDSTGAYAFEELSESEKQAQQEKLDMILGKIDKGENFDILKTQYSEEMDMSKYQNYPNGINICPNDYELYGRDFIKVLGGLDVGECGLYEDEYATFIIKRQELVEFSNLTTHELAVMYEFETYVQDYKIEKFYSDYEVEINNEILERYNIRTIKGLTNTNI